MRIPQENPPGSPAPFDDLEQNRDGHCGPRERFAFSSVMLLGALFALSASPCSRMPMISALVIVGVPLMTFSVAAPSRLGIAREMALLWRGVQAFALRSVLFLLGRGQDARTVRHSFEREVEQAYTASSWRVLDAVEKDPARLHHARRLASFATALAILGGLSLPFIRPNEFTFGQGAEGAFVFGLDLLTFALAGRLVAERILVRLFEAGVALSEVQGEGGVKLRITPLTTLLGAALGAVGALVVVSAGAVACGIETSLLDGATGMHEAAFWFIRKVSPMGLPIGIAAGAILGAGMGVIRPSDDDEDA